MSFLAVESGLATTSYTGMNVTTKVRITSGIRKGAVPTTQYFQTEILGDPCKNYSTIARPRRQKPQHSGFQYIITPKCTGSIAQKSGQWATGTGTIMVIAATAFHENNQPPGRIQVYQQQKHPRAVRVMAATRRQIVLAKRLDVRIQGKNRGSTPRQKNHGRVSIVSKLTRRNRWQ